MRRREDRPLGQPSFRDQLFEAGFLLPTGVDGVYGRSAAFERLLASVDQLVRDAGPPDDRVELSFPPVMSREDYDKIEYLRRFSSLAGVVSVFGGTEDDHGSLMRAMDNGEPVDCHLAVSELALVSACCHPVYPSLAGDLAPEGATVTLLGQCFRREPSVDPFRLQWFRQREHVRVASAEAIEAWRVEAMARAISVFERLALPHTVDAASDAFFGRTGRLLARGQQDLELKVEFVVPVGDGEFSTACASLNLHRDHFGSVFGIRTPDGAVASSACLGFGLERITMALLAMHGLEPRTWSRSVRGALGMT